MTPDKWIYVDEAKREWSLPVTLAELDSLRAAGKIRASTEVINTRVLQRNRRANPIRYSAIARLGVEFTPTIQAFHADRADKPVTVLSGPNNCGKTLLLKQLFRSEEHTSELQSPM